MRSVALMLALAATTAYAVNVHSDVHKLVRGLYWRCASWPSGRLRACRFAGGRFRARHFCTFTADRRA